MAELEMKHIQKRYASHVQAIDDFNLHIQDQAFIVFVGPSGCGKSTLLRMIAGLESITEGDLYMDGDRINNMAPKDRDVAMVFQNYALYPHMNVYDNMAFGLKLRKFNKRDIETRVRHTAEMLGLGDYLNRKPKALSGGQTQRVALGRAIVRDPRLFLMDEPLSNLDANLRSQMRYEIQKLHKRLQTTTIYVTHDQTEAMTMATRLVVLKDGSIQQVGAPKDVHDYPANMFVGGFIGSPSMNFLYGVLRNRHFIIGNHSFTIPEEKRATLHVQGYRNKSLILGIRPENIHHEPAFRNAVPNTSFSATVEAFELLGAETYLYSHLNNQELTVRVPARLDRYTGDTLDLAFDMTKASFFDPDTAYRIHD